LQAIEDQPPDAATLDVSLGGRRAYEAAEELRARSIPFIFVTGYGVRVDCPETLSGHSSLDPIARPRGMLEFLMDRNGRRKGDGHWRLAERA